MRKGFGLQAINEGNQTRNELTYMGIVAFSAVHIIVQICKGHISATDADTLSVLLHA